MSCDSTLTDTSIAIIQLSPFPTRNSHVAARRALIAHARLHAHAQLLPLDILSLLPMKNMSAEKTNPVLFCNRFL